MTTTEGATQEPGDIGYDYGTIRLRTLREAIREAGFPDLLGWNAEEGADAPNAATLTAEPLDIAVVGAGFAGLASAYFLKQLGHRVTVFEARDRVGGRVWTQEVFGSFKVEFGAELIGWNFAVWRGLAEVLGLTVAKLGSTQDASGVADPLNAPADPAERSGNAADEPPEMLLKLDGQAIDDPRPILDGMAKLDDRLAVLAAGVKPYRPWEPLMGTSGPIGVVDDSRSLQDWIDKQTEITGSEANDKLVRRAFSVKFGNNNVVEAGRQSLLAVLSTVAGEGYRRSSDTETSRCSQGNDALAKGLAQKLEDRGAAIFKRSRVTKITHDASRKKVNIRAPEPTAANDLLFDYVIVAVPPPVWSGSVAGNKLEILDLKPDLYATSGGVAVKHFSPLSGEVWGLNPASSMNSKAGMTWQSRPNRSTPTQVFALFAGGGAAEEPIAPPFDVDTFYTSEIGSLYPAYEPGLLDRPLTVRWDGSTALTGWAYSCAAVGEVRDAGTESRAQRVANAVANPKEFADGRILFAGEHACPAFYGYMEGALESGLLAVDELLHRAGQSPGGRRWVMRSALERAALAGSELAPGSYFIVNVSTGQGFDSLGEIYATYPRLSPCGPSPVWELAWVSTSEEAVPHKRLFNITHPATSKQLDLYRCLHEPQTPLILHPRNGSEAQHWQLAPGAKGWVITNAAASTVVELSPPPEVVLQSNAAKPGDDRQEWLFVPALTKSST